MQNIIVCCLKNIDYDDAWILQKRIQDELIRAKKSTPIVNKDHVFLMVEHPPVYTLGKNGNQNNLLLSEDQLAQRGATFRHIGRGGDITFHGPGQLVGYPILDLDRFKTDLGWYLRTLEEVIIRTCDDYDISAGRIKGKTGVWLGDKPLERKICAMGIRCSRWVSMHGFALNINTDLSYFSHIIPCGIQDGSVTSMAGELNRNVDEVEVQSRLLNHFADLFDVNLTILKKDDALSYINSYVSETVN